MPNAKNLIKWPEQPNAMFLSVRPNIQQSWLVSEDYHTFLSSLYIWWLAKCSMWQWSLVNQTYPNIVMCDNAPPHLGGHLFSITLIAHHITMIACVEVEILKCFGSRQKVQHVLSISSCCNERSCLWYFFYYAMVLIWISTFFQLIYCNKVAHDLAVLCSMHCRCINILLTVICNI